MPSEPGWILPLIQWYSNSQLWIQMSQLLPSVCRIFQFLCEGRPFIGRCRAIDKNIVEIMPSTSADVLGYELLPTMHQVPKPLTRVAILVGN